MSLNGQVRSLAKSLDKLPQSTPRDRYDQWRYARQREWVAFDYGKAPPETWPSLEPPYPLDPADEEKYLQFLVNVHEKPDGETIISGYGMRLWAIREAWKLGITDQAAVRALWPPADLSETPPIRDGEDSPLLDAIIAVIRAASRAAGCGWVGPGDFDVED